MIGKIVSWNVRGVNNRGKRLVIKGCLKKWKPTIVCLQETKIDDYSSVKTESLWRENNWD